MNSKLICIQGNKDTGKNEAALMLQFLLNTPKIFHSYFWFKNLKNLNWENKKNAYHLGSYANKLKSIVGTLLNTPIEKFEDRDFKENHYVDFNTMSIYHKDDIDITKTLTDAKFTKAVKKLDSKICRENLLSVRQVLQFFGTELLRHFINDDIWILSALKNQNHNLIITDQRFINEYEKSKEHNAYVIHITRPGRMAGSHSSEAELQNMYNEKLYDYEIKNDGSLQDLFDACKELLKFKTHRTCICNNPKQYEAFTF